MENDRISGSIHVKTPICGGQLSPKAPIISGEMSTIQMVPSTRVEIQDLSIPVPNANIYIFA